MINKNKGKAKPASVKASINISPATDERIVLRQETETALREGDERFGKILQEVPSVAVQGYTMDGTTTYWNRASEEFYGYSAAEAIGRNLIDLIIPPEMKEAVAQAIREMAETGQPIPASELSLQRKDGSRVTVYSSHAIVQIPGRAKELFCLDIDLSARKQAEADRQESEERFRLLFDSSRDSVFLTVPDGRILEANPAACRLLDRTEDEIKRIGRNGVVDTSDPRLALAIEARRRTGTFNGELTFLRKNGEKVHCDVSTSVFKDKHGNERTSIIARDITERQRVVAALRESEERYHRITEAVTDYIYTVRMADGQGTETVHGPGCLAVTGYEAHEFTGDSFLWLRMVTMEDRPLVEEQARRILAGEDPPPIEHRITHKNGSTRWVRNTFVPHRDTHGTLTAYDGLIQDITARKQAEDALRKNKQQYDKLAAQIPIGIYILRSQPTGKFSLDYASPKMAEIFATSVASLLADAQIVLRSIHPDEAEAFARLNREGIELQRPFNWEGRALVQGSVKWLHIVSSPEPQESGDVLWFGIVNDITAPKKAEAALRESENLLREAQSIAGLGSYVLDIPTGVWRSSDVLDIVFGIDQTYDHSITGWESLIHPADRTMMSDYFRREILGQRQGFNKEYRIIRQDNQTERWVHGIGQLVFDPEGRPVVMRGTIQDITKRKQAEKAIAALALRNQTLLQTASDGIHVLDEQGNVVEANAAFCDLLGYTREEVLELNVADWDAQWTHEELLLRIGELMKKPAVFETRHRRKDDTVREVEINGIGISLEGKNYLYASARDITGRKQAEANKEKLAAQNQQLQKAESLSRMAGAIAHHFNNQLQAVMLRLEMAINDLPRHIEPVESLTEAMVSARKAAEMSTLMLTYLGQTYDKNEQLDLAKLCAHSLDQLRERMPQKVNFQTELPSPGPRINANALQIQQVLINLVTNAWEACGENGGTIRLVVKTVPGPKIPPTNRFPLDWQPRDVAYACLEILDTGAGVAAQDTEKLFDPFFSSKFAGRGLGLSVVLGIVRVGHGAVTVESRLGHGSAFRVFFPLSAKEPKPSEHFHEKSGRIGA